MSIFTLNKTTLWQTITVLLLLSVPVFAFAGNASFAQEILWNIVASFFGMLAGLAGLLLNSGISDYVIGFGTNYSVTGVGGAVDTLWVSVRDLFNLTFIFGLVYIGFKMILNSDDSNTRRWLINLILAALLVNFSLYFTKVIVDLSNSLATQIAVNGFLVNNLPSGNAQIGVSEIFMNAVGLQEIWSLKPGDLPPGASGSGAYGYIFGTAIMLIVMTFVFAAGGIMLLIRYVALSLYMALSPLMFLGWVFPQLQSVTSKYWRGFLGKAFFAPIYLLLLYFAANILTTFMDTVIKGGNGKTAYTDVFSGRGDSVINNFVATIPPFAITCIFLLAAVVIANKLGADGASTALRIGNNIKGRAQRAVQRGTVNSAKFVGAQTGGRVLRRGSYVIGNSLERQIDRMQKSDNKLIRGMSNSVGVDEVFRGGAGKLQNSRYGMSNTVSQENEKKRVIDKRYADKQTEDKGRQAEKDNKKYDRNNDQILDKDGNIVTRSALSSDEREELEKLEEARDKSIADMQSLTTSMTLKQLEAMYKGQPDKFKEIVGQMKNNQFDKMMDSDNLDATQKENLLKMRQDSISSVIEQNGEVVTEEISKMSSKQIETMGAAWIRKNAHHLTNNQMDSIMKSESFTEQQRGMFKNYRKAGQERLLGDNTNRQALFHNTTGVQIKDGNKVNNYSDKQKKPEEIATLPPSVLLDSKSLPYINAGVLEKIFEKKTLDAAQREVLKKNILEEGTDEAKAYLESELGRRNWNNPKNTGSGEGSQKTQTPPAGFGHNDSDTIITPN